MTDVIEKARRVLKTRLAEIEAEAKQLRQAIASLPAAGSRPAPRGRSPRRRSASQPGRTTPGAKRAARS